MVDRKQSVIHVSDKQAIYAYNAACLSDRLPRDIAKREKKKFDHWRIHGDQSPNNCDSIGTVFVLQCQNVLLFFFVRRIVRGTIASLYVFFFVCVFFQ